jgi:outer membrane receptor protein involved in Fe transport
MIGIIGKSAIRLALISSSVSAIAMSAVPAMAQQTARSFDIPSQPLSSALAEFSKQSDTLIMTSRERTAGKRSRALKGNMHVNEALGRLLSGSGLRAVPNPDGGYRVERNAGNGQAIRAESTSSLGEGAVESATENNGMADIVVTAQKREQRLQDVPVPIAVLQTATLAESNQTRVQDYYTKVPGLSLILMGDVGSPTIAIRGVTTGRSTNPTVGVIVDEVPYGSTTTQGSGFIIPDIDPSDLDRIEVLRGPQGTLYGASSIGGLLKFVTRDPSTSDFSGRLQAGIGGVRNGNRLSYNLRGALNVPISDTLALRASGFTTDDSGYVDNISTGREGVNRRTVDGGRASLLWKPSNEFSVRLSALLQNSRRLGSGDVNVGPGFGPLEQIGILGSGGYERKTEVYSATIKADLGIANLTSATGYSIDRNYTFLDFTPAFGSFAQATFGVAGVTTPYRGRTEKISEELRLDIPVETSVDLLVGVFFTEEKVSTAGEFNAVDLTNGQVVGAMLVADTPSKYTEYAAFSDVTFHITDRLDLQVGGRMSWNKQSFSTTWSGPLADDFFFSDPYIIPLVEAKDKAFTYLLTPSYKVSSDLLIYARLASGYRPGGPNATCIPSIPCQYSADKTRNYEIGAKGKILDGALSFDLSAYYIDWKNIQLNLARNGLGYADNAGAAKSQGLELSVVVQPTTSLSITGWIAYNDAQLTEGFPVGTTPVGARGDRLPYSSRWSGNISADYVFSLGGDVDGSVGGSASFVGDRIGDFVNTSIRQIFPSYTQLDLRAGLKYDEWALNAFVTNIVDKRGLLRGGIGALDPTAFAYIQPRTIGLSISRTF